MFRFAAVLCFCVLSSVCAELSDDDKENFRKVMVPVAKVCMEELGIDIEDLKEMKKNKEMDPCFILCLFKARGTIDKNGKFDSKTSFEAAKEIISDENVLGEIRKIGETCMKVNDEDVKDECGRAKLLMDCFHDNKAYIHDV